MELRIVATAEIVERDELLNGTQTVTLEGASEDGAWSLVGSVSWNRGLVDFPGEGDLTLSRDDGEIFATVTQVEVAQDSLGGDQEAGQVLKVRYDVDGGSGAFDAARGTATAHLAFAGDDARGTWVLSLSG